MKILITSGGTKVPIDDVRYITNMSSGRYAAKIAEEFYDQCYDTIFFYAKHSVKPVVTPWQNSPSLEKIEYSTYDEYSKVIDLVEKIKPEIIISAAAVSDFIVDKTEGKISSSDDEVYIKLKRAKKILPEFKKVSPKSFVVGFKLLVSPTEQEKKDAIEKTLNHGADIVVYNDLTEIRKGNDTRYIHHKNMNTASEHRSAKDLKDAIRMYYIEHILKKL